MQNSQTARSYADGRTFGGTDDWTDAQSDARTVERTVAWKVGRKGGSTRHPQVTDSGYNHQSRWRPVAAYL